MRSCSRGSSAPVPPPPTVRWRSSPADERHVVRLEDGQEIAARTVLLATGAQYRRLPVDDLSDYEGVSVFYAAGPPEQQLCGASRVGVVGGGNSAGQAAVWLARGGALVTLLHRRADLRETMSDYLVRELERYRVAVRDRSEIAALHGDAGRLEAVTLKTGERVPLSFLFLFLGARPCTEWLDEAIARDDDGFILTGPAVGSENLLETSVPGVFAAGDVRSGSTKRCADRRRRGGDGRPVRPRPSRPASGSARSVAESPVTLYQAEWCPFSSAVREVLTELGIDAVIRQVEPWPEQRAHLREVAGTDQIPVLQTEDGQLFRGTRTIFAHLSDARAMAVRRRTPPPLRAITGTRASPMRPGSCCEYFDGSGDLESLEPRAAPERDRWSSTSRRHTDTSSCSTGAGSGCWPTGGTRTGSHSPTPRSALRARDEGSAADWPRPHSTMRGQGARRRAPLPVHHVVHRSPSAVPRPRRPRAPPPPQRHVGLRGPTPKRHRE